MEHTWTTPKLGFRNASVAEQIAICREFLLALQKLPPEKRPQVPVEEFEAGLAKAVGLQLALLHYRQLVSQKVTEQDEAMADLRQLARRSMQMMVSVARGDKGRLLDAGLKAVSSKRIRTGPPGAPTQLRARVRHESIELLWKSPLRRSIFTVEAAEESPENGWMEAAKLVQTRVTLAARIPGRLYWLRVQAWNPNGYGPWSNPIAVRAI